MLAQDVPPSRLGRAKADVAALVNRLQGERVGLIAFAGQAVVKCPLTVDYDAFRRSLDELDPGSAPRGGTAIGDAIRKALEVFQSRAERDQAILLITDGDDQQSYPLEAASVAAERHVTVFTVGLGDADQGARIPQGAESKTYLEYHGQQVWSKLDGKLLKEIALKTSGVYVPVGTRAYDLGELYSDYLQGRRGNAAQSQRRIRRAEQFQIFLALALLALLADLFTRPYAAAVKSPQPGIEPREPGPGPAAATRRRPVLSSAVALAACAPFAGVARADNPEASMREGLRLYRADNFDKAREKFAAAHEEFDRTDAAKSAVAAFDEACAFHRKGDMAHAREWYLKAGLAHDRVLAAAAHFNLGTLASEEARGLAGEHPENVAPDKRQEILDHLKGAVASFRHSLELEPDNSRARRDIELVRLWIKYYTDKWQAHDREKRRQETNLLAFLEYLIETQRALRESVKALPARTPADAFAELKRLEDELRDEIAPLKEKIRAELQPAQPNPGTASAASPQELEQGIALLQGWADAAGEKMSSAARQLDLRQAGPAAGEQQAAVDELEKIWDAVIPFAPLLARALTDQTLTAGGLKPAPSADSKSSQDESPEKKAPDRDKTAPPSPAAGPQHSSLGSAAEELARLGEIQERTLRRTRLLKPKAEVELARHKQAPRPGAGQAGKDAKSGVDDTQNAPATQPESVDPKEIQAGYEKAIALAPQAVAHMERAALALEKKDRAAAYPPAEEARKVLEEIQKAQPKNKDSSPKDQEKDKKKDDQQKQDQKQEQKQDEQKSQQQKDQREQNEQQKKDQEQKQKQKQDSSKAAEKKAEQNRPQPQISRDQLEEALRKVRERQQEKGERDRRMRARVSGSVAVEKDW
jgi:hypothetical protein